MLRKKTSECIIFMANSKLKMPAASVERREDRSLEFPTQTVFLPDSTTWNWYCRFPMVFRSFGLPKLEPVFMMMREMHEPKVVFVVYKKEVLVSSCAIASSLLKQGIVGPSTLRILYLNGVCSDIEIARQCEKYSISLRVVVDSRHDKMDPYMEIKRLCMHD
jgi:hypothetical protein